MTTKRCVLVDGTLASAVAVQAELLAGFEPGPGADLDLAMGEAASSTVVIIDPTTRGPKRQAAQRILERVGLRPLEIAPPARITYSELLLHAALAAHRAGASSLVWPVFLGGPEYAEELAMELDRAFLVSQLAALESAVDRFEVRTPVIDLDPEQLVDLGLEVLAPLGDAWIPSDRDQPWGGLDHGQWSELLTPILAAIGAAKGAPA